MKPRWTIAQKEFTSVFKERTILLAVVIQVIVAGFSGFLVVGLSALVDPSAFAAGSGASITIDQDAAADSALRRSLLEAGFHVSVPGNDLAVWDEYTEGGANAALFLTPPAQRGGTMNLTLIVPEGDLRTTLVISQLKEALEDYERALRAERSDRITFTPLFVDVEGKGGSYSFVYSLLIPLLVFLPVVLAGALCADSITEEVQRKTLPLLLASPATPADVVEGKLLANCALAPILAAAWFLLLAVNDLPVTPVGALGILILATAVSYLFGLLACAIALLMRDRNKAHVTYASAMFFLLALSLALPTTPVNAVALLAAGSAHAGVWALIAGLAALALLGALGLRLGLQRSAQWMAAGSA